MSDETPVAENAAATRLDRVDWLSFTVTTALAFAVYLFTLAPEVTLEFSGIFSTGAMYAGVPHPPGYPVWTLYAWLFVKLLPFSNVAWRVAVSSAFAGAVASGIVALMVSRGGKILLGQTPGWARLKPTEQNWLRGVSGYAAGLALGFSDGFWYEAVIADVWALNALLFVAVLWFLMRWSETGRRRFLCVAFFLFGAVLTGNQFLIGLLPGLVCAVMWIDRQTGRDLALTILPLALAIVAVDQEGPWPGYLRVMNGQLRLWFWLAIVFGVCAAITTRRVGSEWKTALAGGLCLLLGLAFYFYLPMASATNPPVNWGNPRTVEGFRHMISRGQYEQVHPTNDFATFGRQLWLLVRTSGHGFGWPYLVFTLVPVAFLRRVPRTNRRWLVGLIPVAFAVGPFLLGQLNPFPDRQNVELVVIYFSTLHAVLAIWAGVGLILLGTIVTKCGRQPAS